ncbi:YacL family protein [Vibrio sp. RC27]
MDYEFIKDNFLNEYHAKFSLEHQIVGRWLVEEIGHDRTMIEQVYQLLQQASTFPTKEHLLVGNEISMIILQDEVTIEENTINQCIESELESDFSIYTSESSALCGIDDFTLMFKQWNDFIQNS